MAKIWLEKEISRQFVCFIKPKFKILRSSLAFFLLFGTLFIPLRAEAGFLYSLLGDPAYAETTSGLLAGSVSSNSNSQNIALLQAKVTSLSVIEAKNNQKDKDTDTSQSASFAVSDNALVPTVGAMNGTGGADLGDEEVSAEDIYFYKIRKGDSLSQIAEMYDVSVNTILWANDMKKGDKLIEGEILIILPISGVKHVVAKGQTLKGLASLYKVDIETITSFNGLSVGDALVIGDELLIPEAEMPNDDTPNAVPKKSKGSTIASKLKAVAGFINPVPELRRKSQGLHGPGNRGVDLAAPTGTRILASAGGQVLLARNGYNGGYGNMVTISHPNGTKTLYAHMSKMATTTGAQVKQGEVIGYIGSTGKSTGPHLHFEVFNAKNPGSDWSWSK
ncbi:peptidoglycan DD-metalloendopeptidase family protein [Candidatus Nomurabacteria bacterium]|nr:peptidoglycan DD-metalloendopeptidase family protein [Candidatus Nomurabacteria bacterium]